MIPICLILFILFIAVITFAIKRADSAQAKVTEEFWEKERKANSTLRGDTTDLCYITIPERFFPLNNDKINDLKDKTLINLTGMTNTDLKLKYGILNFKKLSEYDDNFTKFVSCCQTITTGLLKQAMNRWPMNCLNLRWSRVLIQRAYTAC